MKNKMAPSHSLDRCAFIRGVSKATPLNASLADVFSPRLVMLDTLGRSAKVNASICTEQPRVNQF